MHHVEQHISDLLDCVIGADAKQFTQRKNEFIQKMAMLVNQRCDLHFNLIAANAKDLQQQLDKCIKMLKEANIEIPRD